MDITQVAPKVRYATVVRKDFATNAALDMLLIALLEVLPNTRPLRPWDSYGLRCLYNETQLRKLAHARITTTTAKLQFFQMKTGVPVLIFVNNVSEYSEEEN